MGCCGSQLRAMLEQEIASNGSLRDGCDKNPPRQITITTASEINRWRSHALSVIKGSRHILLSVQGRVFSDSVIRSGYIGSDIGRAKYGIISTSKTFPCESITG
jgi:hypothetical protein